MILPGFKTTAILKIKIRMGELQCEPENFTDRILFMSMFHDIEWDAKGNDEFCESNSKSVAEYAQRFPRGHWSFLGPGSETKWHGTYDGTPSGYWTQTAEKMLLNFERSGHPFFRCTSALEKGQLRSKERGKTTFHFTACEDNVQSLLKMVMSVNQLSLYGAVADVIQELPEDQVAPGRPVAFDQTEQEILLATSYCRSTT